MKTLLAVYAAYILLFIAAVVGWAMNLITVVHLFTANEPMTTMFIGRIIGLVVFPLGGVLGYL